MYHRWIFLIIISLGLLMIAMDNSILYTALPSLYQQLGVTERQGLWIINAYPLVLASLLLGTGTLGDKIGHRRMFEVGLVTFGLASLAAAFSPQRHHLDRFPGCARRRRRHHDARHSCAPARHLHRCAGT